MVVAVIIVAGERATRGEEPSCSRSARPAPEHWFTSPGWRRALSVGLLAGYGLVALGVPILVMAVTISRGLERRPGPRSETLWVEAGRTLGVAVVAGLITAVAALPVAMVIARRSGRLSGWVESVVWGSYSLPHITVGVAAVGFALQWARPLYQSLIFLLIIYLAVFLPQAVGSVQDSLRRASPDLEDASRGLGVGPMRTMFRITLPLAMPGLVAGGALVFLSAMKELPATLLLRPNGFETLAVRIWSSTAEGFLTRASAAGLVLLLVSIVPLFLVMSRDLSD